MYLDCFSSLRMLVEIELWGLLHAILITSVLCVCDLLLRDSLWVLPEDSMLCLKILLFPRASYMLSY